MSIKENDYTIINIVDTKDRLKEPSLSENGVNIDSLCSSYDFYLQDIKHILRE